VPVPVVLQKENVKTLPHDIFTKLEALSAPRLVEYWEEDPCQQNSYEEGDMAKSAAAPTAMAAGAGGAAKDYGVTIEAKFSVGEYDILILGAKESDGLEAWLHDNKYNIPQGASAALAPYIKEQQKFFVAKVNIKKVQMDQQGVAVLSPLRFAYESQDFRLPVRLGLLNAKSKQDLIVFVLARSMRYEVANYKNVFIPTNIDVTDSTRNAFAPFYATLFDATIAKAGGKAVVTEYAWESSSCDPCPTPPLQDDDVATLGGDVLFGMGVPQPVPGGPPNPNGGMPMPPGGMGGGYYGGGMGVVLTRLHTRYDQQTLTDDLVFRAAEAVVGGREFMQDNDELEKGARPDSYNNFQGRYAIRHEWTGPINCPNPKRHVWGGPPGGGGNGGPVPATNLASAPRGNLKLADHVTYGLDDVDSYDKAVQWAYQGNGGPPPVKNRACGCSIPGSDGNTWSIFGGVGALAALTLVMMRRRAR
jgi:MYXO-CTERM domain-containing protein